MAARILTRIPRSGWLAAAVAAALHLAFLGAPLGTDEGGFTLVARHWNDAGSYLYGPLWVDRPPGLFLFFSAAAVIGPHVVAASCSVVLVLATATSARAVAGERAIAPSAWAAAAFSSSAFLSAQQLNGELAAATLVAVAIAALVTSDRLDVAFGAGLAAVGAVLVKQNFVDGVVFGLVLLLLAVGRGAAQRRMETRRAAGFVAGVLAMAGVTLLWTIGRGGPGALFYAMYGFRLDANRVLAHTAQDGPDAVRGLAFATASGIVLVLVAVLVRAARRVTRPSASDGVAIALTAAIAVELVGVVLGGSWWPHYFIALVPTVALAAALVGGRAVKVGIALSVVSAVVATAVYAVQVRVTTSPDQRVADFLGRNAAPSDSGLVVFTHVNVLEMAGLKPAYPFDWSLPIRVRDPRLDLMVATLAGPEPPTWVVRWDPASEWGLDPQDLVQAALGEHYHEVAVICGHPIWLLDVANHGAGRSIAGPTRGC